MKINKAKEHAAKMLKVGKQHIWVDPKQLEKVTSAITKEDVKQLLVDEVIKKDKKQSQSKGRARILANKKKLGRKSGAGKKKGTKKARSKPKKQWISKVRAQRRKLRELRVEDSKAVEEKGYSKVYKMIKGNFFKGKKYVEQYIKDQK